MRHRLQTSLIAPLALAICLPVTADFAIRSETVHGEPYVYLADVAHYYGLGIQRRGKEVTLSGKGRHLALTLQRREAMLQGVQVHLGFAPVEQNGNLLLAERDLSLTLDPIWRGWGLGRRQIRRIVIDPGHGGRDDGARGSRTREKELVLAISNRLARLLRAKGYEVDLTRTADTYPSLRERGLFARRQRADLFLSIHCNAVDTASVHGIETYVVTPRHTPSTPKREPEDEAVEGNAFDRHNTRLGFELQRQLLKATGADDRGLKRHRFQVLREAGCPAALLELGFVSNLEEERKLATPAYQERLARGLANGVIYYHRALYEISR